MFRVMRVVVVDGVGKSERKWCTAKGNSSGGNGEGNQKVLREAEERSTSNEIVVVV